MKNKKGFVGFVITMIIFAGLIYVAIVYVAIPVWEEHQNYLKYKAFCEDKPNFCYCDNGIVCEFKTSWSSQTRFSNETLALCKLAKELNDKETMFKAGCE